MHISFQYICGLRRLRIMASVQWRDIVLQRGLAGTGGVLYSWHPSEKYQGIITTDQAWIPGVTF